MLCILITSFLSAIPTVIVRDSRQLRYQIAAPNTRYTASDATKYLINTPEDEASLTPRAPANQALLPPNSFLILHSERKNMDQNLTLKYRLFFEKRSLGSSSSCSSRSTRALQTLRQGRWYSVGYMIEHNILMDSLQKDRLGVCFHFLTVVIGVDLTRLNHLLAGAARFRCLQTETHKMSPPGSSGEDVPYSLFSRSFASEDIVSTLSNHQKLASDAQSAHKTIAAAPASGFDTLV
ncbi:unnamed protein product [Diplocarpon coronariae]